MTCIKTVNDYLENIPAAAATATARAKMRTESRVTKLVIDA